MCLPEGAGSLDFMTHLLQCLVPMRKVLNYRSPLGEENTKSEYIIVLLQLLTRSSVAFDTTS